MPSLKPNWRVIPRVGTKPGFTVKIPLHKVKIPCRVIDWTSSMLLSLFRVDHHRKSGNRVSPCSKLRALIANGLTGIDLTRCWISWRIQPLSLRGDLMCNYTGDPTDVQRLSQVNLSEDEVNKATKKLLGETQEKCNKTGLAPFYLTKPVPQVSVFVLSYLFCP